MKFEKWTDFLFTGLAVVPVALAFAGRIELAVLVFVPLLFAACGCGVLERECGDPAAPGAPSGGEQVQHAVEPGVIERVGRVGADDGFRMVGHAHAGLGHEREVIRAVAQRDDLAAGDSKPVTRA